LQQVSESPVIEASLEASKELNDVEEAKIP
jgi:hypothetical protein